jgi:phenylacetic acid degradation operon negative regulatory protein
MLQLLIAVSKVRDTTAEPRPLDARSLALSALLGTHPPVLPARALVGIGELFGIAGGTMRTALSRMTATGEVVADDGRYRLVGSLLDRQRAQDTGRRAPTAAWGGDWHLVVTLGDRRALAERRRFRALMTDHRLGELRPDVWMRPANLDAPPAGPGWIVATGPVAADDDVDGIVDRLWDLDSVAATARSLDADLGRMLADLDVDDAADTRSIVPLFTASTGVVRFLRAEPLLPTALLPEDWPPHRLRASYDIIEAALQRRLRAFFAARR